VIYLFIEQKNYSGFRTDFPVLSYKFKVYKYIFIFAVGYYYNRTTYENNTTNSNARMLDSQLDLDFHRFLRLDISNIIMSNSLFQLFYVS